MCKSKYSEHQVIAILKAVEAGRTVRDICREYEISEPTTMRGRRTVEIDGKFKAHPDSVTRGRHVVYDRVSGQQLVIFHTSGASSALDAAEISDSRDVGATGVFDPNIDGRRLQFRYEKGGFVDAETGSRWNILGQAVSGELRGKQLRSIAHGDYFAFAWFAFRPETEIFHG